MPITEVLYFLHCKDCRTIQILGNDSGPSPLIPGRCLGCKMMQLCTEHVGMLLELSTGYVLFTSSTPLYKNEAQVLQRRMGFDPKTYQIWVRGGADPELEITRWRVEQ